MTKKADALKTVRPKFLANAVYLVRTRGTPTRGGGLGGESWRIEVGGKRVGTVFINLIDEKPLGRHASLQIYLNQKSQGFGIGRIAYRLACEASDYSTIYAHMRKSNIASRRAAEEAGFVEATPASYQQLIMVWNKI
ncbi:GNAT family N-acetyltransferase [Delftia tsuruhatensis]|uniref:GNAT family N-acetyltransferase n=1 Tax=Delftia tsuruhatensis TaxID=180282 RepID=UPI0028ADD84A|nr:GNAT family protein [Delftia tsuruhatensis]